ncbi:hypothetical protein D3C78_1432520 [compost metagenome]
MKNDFALISTAVAAGSLSSAASTLPVSSNCTASGGEAAYSSLMSPDFKPFSATRRCSTKSGISFLNGKASVLPERLFREFSVSSFETI